MAGKLIHVWKHGFFIVLGYGLGVLTGFLYLAAPLVLLNAALGLIGLGILDDELLLFLLALFVIWVPVGIGMVARYVSSDDLKPEDYPERNGRQRSSG